MLRIVKSPKNIVTIDEKKYLRNRETIHYHLSNGYFVMFTQLLMTTVYYLTRTLSAQYTDFLDRAQLLTQKLLKQG
jgi:hypothetical protein